jgi:hypothetical protein
MTKTKEQGAWENCKLHPNRAVSSMKALSFDAEMRA